MAAKTKIASTLTPLQSALLGARHAATNLNESALVAYWLDGRADVPMHQHIGWLIEAYDQLAPHIEVLRAAVARPDQQAA